MKIYNNMDEVTADVKDGILRINDDVTFNCDVVGMFDINALNIIARDINAHDIIANDINAHDIKAQDIDARDIDALNIDANDIKAQDIDAHDIKAWDIDARNIDAHDISYYATCSVMENIVCQTIKGRRPDAKHFSLEHGKIVIKTKERTK